MPPRARQAKPQETAADATPTEAPEETAPPVETPEDQAAPAETADAYTEALLRERAGYVLYGRKDRLADVDAELKRLGVKPPRG